MHNPETQAPLKVFISSTFIDLIAHREKVSHAIERLGQKSVRMEAFGARPGDAGDVCLSEIAQSDVILGIYAHRYGFVPEGQSASITELEFHHARHLGKDIFAFLVDDEFPW